MLGKIDMLYIVLDSQIGGGAQHSTIVNGPLAIIVIAFVVLTILDPYLTNLIARPIENSY